MKKLENNLKYKFEFEYNYNNFDKGILYVYVFENIDSFEFYIQESSCSIIELMFGLPLPIMKYSEIEKIVKNTIFDYSMNYLEDYVFGKEEFNEELIKIY